MFKFLNKNIEEYIYEYDNNIYKNILLNPIFRIKITHFIAVFVLIISSIIFTDNIAASFIQLLLATIIVVHDIDDKKLKNSLSNKIQELNIKEQEISTVVNQLNASLNLVSTHVIYVKLDLDGKIKEASDAFCKISYYTKAELFGRPYMRNVISDNKNLWSDITSVLLWEGETKNIGKNNSFYYLDTVISPEYDEHCTVIGYMSIGQDVTNKKRFHQQHVRLLESEKMAALGDMFGNIAHQWRQPLSIISAIASSTIIKYEYNIEKTTHNDNLIKQMNSIINNTETLSNTIDVFRNFVQDDKVLKMYSINNIINDVLAIIKATLDVHLIKIIININPSKDVKSCLVEGELSNVLINILNNAKDALVQNNIENPTIIITLNNNNNKVNIGIEDNGGGIPNDVLSKIYEPYFTTKHKAQGTGIGLNMCYSIITKSLNGKIYSKNINNGAKFFIEFPIVKNPIK